MEVKSNVIAAIKPTMSNIQAIANPMITYFVPPITSGLMQWGQTTLVVLFLIVMMVSILYIYVYLNLNQYQDRISVILSAFLFGANPQEKFKQFVQNSQAESIATVMNNIQSTTDDANTTNYRLNDKANRLAKQVAVDVPNSYAQANNLGISIQQNIAQVRDTVSKLGGAFMLNNYMTDGAVKTTKSISAPVPSSQ